MRDREWRDFDRFVRSRTTNPDDWAKIAGKKGERIAHITSLVSAPSAMAAKVEPVEMTGQSL